MKNTYLTILTDDRTRCVPSMSDLHLNTSPVLNVKKQHVRDNLLDQPTVHPINHLVQIFPS